ncbi:allantoate amidohydrolase [Stappia sp. 22II-S9-Z10]|nr:allantoate amidohydrolase [Stappia sp. 22II-S9-Z10]
MPPRQTTAARPAIDGARLAALLAEINSHGANPATGGYDRPAFSPADMAARRAFLAAMEADGLSAHMDAAGNVIGRIGPPGPAILIGSHLDTVPSGGPLDGALGCAVALECVRAIRDAGVRLTSPIAVVATADEEGRFGGMLGSQALAGVLPNGWADRATDSTGVRLADAMRAAGLDASRLADAALAPGSVRAFLELHIEQGPVLEAAGVDIGIATAVSGCAVLDVVLEGAANHSGTTPMDMRRDAFVGLSRIGAALPAVARDHGTGDARLTIGAAALSPNAAHTIPGRADCTIILRDMTGEAMDALTAAVLALVEEAAEAERLAATITVRSRLEPVALDPALQAAFARSAAALPGTSARTMPSGAGHDAQTMAALCPSALIFVPSRGGISHAPDEFTPWPAIERGAAVFLATVTGLATA